MQTPKPLVLIIDDSEPQRRLYELLAERIGITAHVVQGCAQGLEALSITEFDLILTDWMLPDGNGLDCQNLIREKLAARFKMVPIICVTARAQIGDRELCLRSGMDDYLAKPFTIEQLYEIVHKWLSKPANGKQSQQHEPASIKNGES